MSEASDPVTFAKALADDTRQKIMSLCCCCWLNVGEIVAAINVSQPTVSHHLSILRSAGLVNVRREGARPGGGPGVLVDAQDAEVVRDRGLRDVDGSDNLPYVQPAAAAQAHDLLAGVVCQGFSKSDRIGCFRHIQNLQYVCILIDVHLYVKDIILRFRQKFGHEGEPGLESSKSGVENSAF